MYNLTDFTSKDMIQCGAAIRQAASSATSMEAAACLIVQHLYRELVDSKTGQGACALVRIFKTHRLGDLDGEIKSYACSILGDAPNFPDMQCLTLLATAGDQPDWNDRRKSAGHRTIPLQSQQMVNQSPMISQLVAQLGLEVNTVLHPQPELLLDISKTTYNVFYIPHATASPFIPAQREFVIPFHIKSVLGFGGVFPSGALFASILFSKTFIPRQTANMFKPLALSVKVALLPFDGCRIWADG